MWFPPPPYFPQHPCRQWRGMGWKGEDSRWPENWVKWRNLHLQTFPKFMDRGPTSGLYCQSSWGQNYSVKWECRKQAQKSHNCRRTHPTVAESSSTCFLLKKAQEIWLLCTSTLTVRKYHVLTSFYSSQKRQNKNQWLEIKSQTTLHKKYDIHLLSNAD